MAYGYNKANSSEGSAGQRALDRFTSMIIDRLEVIKASDWKKGWIDLKSNVGMPQNLSGRSYSGSNSFFLFMDTAINHYRFPVYLTFNQAHNLNAHVLKGEKAFPVVYWDFLIKDKEGNKVKREDYAKLSKEERAECVTIPFIKAYPVYNIDQTNLKDVRPELYERIASKFKAPKLPDTLGMYANPAIDRLIDKQEWLCPIRADKTSNKAAYSLTKDYIVIPLKAQFNKGGNQDKIYESGMEYYSTLLHEMTHSTMTPERLNRDAKGRFGDDKYAKEELVAELTAAMVGQSLGFSSNITDNNVAYVDGWLETLKKEPKFILSVMSDVNKASELIQSHIDKQRIALGETTILNKTDTHADGLGKVIDATLIKNKEGGYSITGTYEGENLGMRSMSEENVSTYFKLKDDRQRVVYLNQVATKVFQEEIKSITESKSTSLKLG